MYIFHDESNFSWLAVPLRLAKECLLALLYQKRKMPRFLARAAGLPCADWTERGLQGPNSRSLSKRKVPGEDLAQRPDTEPQTRLQRVGNVPAPCRALVLINRAQERRSKAAPRSPPAPARPARAPGSGDA